MFFISFFIYKYISLNWLIEQECLGKHPLYFHSFYSLLILYRVIPTDTPAR